jgi:hypothetical protein
MESNIKYHSTIPSQDSQQDNGTRRMEMSSVTVYAKVSQESHTELLEIASLTGKHVMTCARDAIEMYIDHENMAHGRNESPDRIIDGQFNKYMSKKRTIEKLSAMLSDKTCDTATIQALAEQYGVSLEELEKHNTDRDIPRNNCRYFVRGLLVGGRLEVGHIYRSAETFGFSKSQIKRSLSDVATPIKVGVSDYYWELK